MLTAVVTVTGSEVSVRFPASSDEAEGEDGGAEPTEPPDDLNPIFPELKEVAWGFGAFIVLALLMRFLLFPRLKTGMDQRYNSIQGDHDTAEQLTASAREDVASYEAQLAQVRAEAASRVDAARQQLESERAEKLAEANARIAERRSAANAEVDAAREAARDQVEAAVSQVAARASELATGRAPDAAMVNEVVADTVRAGVSR